MNDAYERASYHALERALSAFRLSRDMAVNGIELDVQLSHDGTGTVIYDSGIERATHGSGTEADLASAEAKRLDPGSWLPSAFTGERIPTLAQRLEAVRQSLTLDMELKVRASEPGALEEGMSSFIVHYRMEDQMLISSSGPPPLHRMCQSYPHLPLFLQYGSHASEVE